jgi:hypothetical protein
MKKTILSLILLSLLNSAFALEKLVLHGKNYGRSLIVQNPFAADAKGFSIQEIKINGIIPNAIEIFGNVFEINLSENGVKLNGDVIIEILYKEGSQPKVYNPEVLTEPNLEGIALHGDSEKNSSYYLKDRSLYIIKGKLTREDQTKGLTSFWIELSEISKNDTNNRGSCQTNIHGDYLLLAKADRLYNLIIYDSVYEHVQKKILLDLRGIPDDKKKGQMIYVNFTLPVIRDKRIEKLNAEFPVQKMYFNSVTQTLEWDDDYAKAINTAASLLSKQISQESDMKVLQVEKEAEQKQKKYLYLIIAGIFLITIGSIFAFLRQRSLRKLIDAQKKEVEQQKHLIEDKNREVMDSIHYAKRIQLAQIPSEKMIANLLKRLKK